MYGEGQHRITSLSDPHGRSIAQLREATRSIATHPLNGMLGRCRVTPSCLSPVPIYTPGLRETRDNVEQSFFDKETTQ